MIMTCKSCIYSYCCVLSIETYLVKSSKLFWYNNWTLLTHALQHLSNSLLLKVDVCHPLIMSVKNKWTNLEHELLKIANEHPLPNILKGEGLPTSQRPIPKVTTSIPGRSTRWMWKMGTLRKGLNTRRLINKLKLTYILLLGWGSYL